MSVNNDIAKISTIAKSLVLSISEAIQSTTCIKCEGEGFLEICCLLYRASLAIMEMQTSESIPKNATDALRSMSDSVLTVQDFVKKFEQRTESFSDSEVNMSIVHIGGELKHMGGCLDLISSSTFLDQEYAQVAVGALANEMKNFAFEVVKEMETQSFFSEEKKEETEAIESDLYPVNFEGLTSDSHVLDSPSLDEFLKNASFNIRRNDSYNRSESVMSLPQMVDYVEPLYETFYCPLTKEIMNDPVTVETGVTYERKAIIEWFEEFDNSKELLCPATRQKLSSGVLRPNIALKTTIDEWKGRNEAARIKVSRAALSVAGSVDMVLEAIRGLQEICRGHQSNRIQVRIAGIVPLLVKFLEYKDEDVRHATLELLLQLAEGDDDGKEMIVKIVGISSIIKMLSTSHQSIKNAALLLLLELSRSRSLCKNIGSAPGGILMLVRIKFNKSVDSFASQMAGEILKNLEFSSENIKKMAESGFLEPLLNHLDRGSEEMQLEMAMYLNEVVLGHDSKSYVAERASAALTKMVQNGNSLTRKSAFKALAKLSPHHPNIKILVKAGIVQTAIEEMLNRKICNDPMNSVFEAASVLANIFETGLELENLQVNSYGHKLTSDYVLYNIICMINNSTPEELNISLMKILLCLSKSPESLNTIVAVVQETEASYTLIELINNPCEEVTVKAIKLLVALSPDMGHIIVERLCKIRGQPENLILRNIGTSQITEMKAVSAKFIASLSQQSLTLNLDLLGKNIVPVVIQTINQIQASGTLTSRHAGPYLEGLVGILVRFTTTLYEPQCLFVARSLNFTLVFTELLTKTSSDEVQRLSAIGLENLSSESINLSKPPRIRRTKFLKLFYLPKFLAFLSSKKRKVPVCPVHKGTCSSQETFCLIEAKAVDRLLGCLDHENDSVVEAALSAICTLLDEKVDIDKSVDMLSRVDAIQHVLKVVKEHQNESLRHKCFWVIERFLVKGGENSNSSPASDMSQDRLLLANLVSAFHYSDDDTRLIAERILRHLNQIPKNHFSSYTL